MLYGACFAFEWGEIPARNEAKRFGLMAPDIKVSDLKRREVLSEMLTRRRDEVYMRVKELRQDQEHEAEPPAADSMEAARSSAEIETHAGLIGRAEDELRLFAEALERVEHGRYGACAECGEEIPTERLTAVPFALYCVSCQQKQNHARRPWGEGTMIPPYDHQWTLPEEMQEPREYRVTTDLARPPVRIEEAPPPGVAEPVKPASEKARRARPQARRPRRRPT